MRPYTNSAKSDEELVLPCNTIATINYTEKQPQTLSNIEALSHDLFWVKTLIPEFKFWRCHKWPYLGLAWGAVSNKHLRKAVVTHKKQIKHEP